MGADVRAAWHADGKAARRQAVVGDQGGAAPITGRTERTETGSERTWKMKTVMGWIDKIVSSLARRTVNKNEGRSGGR